MQTTDETLLGIGSSPGSWSKYLIVMPSAAWFRAHPEDVVRRLPRGTKLEVVNIRQQHLGMFERCWRVEVKVLDGVNPGVVSDIPACSGTDLPSWLNTSETKLKPGDQLTIKPEFAVPCD